MAGENGFDVHESIAERCVVEYLINVSDCEIKKIMGLWNDADRLYSPAL